MNNISSRKSQRILVVDDMRINQMLLLKILEDSGHIGDGALSGVDAIAQIGKTHYDLIFMDCIMPDMDGIETTRQIRQAEEFLKRKPAIIIACTGDDKTDDRAKCLHAGMNDYLTKPIQKEQIAAMLDKWAC